MKKVTEGISAGYLKMVALIIMFVDHVAATIIMCLASNTNHPLTQWIAALFGGDSLTMIEVYNVIATLYTTMRYIGRISFPIYRFFLVEGFVHTRSRKKYMRRLVALALISEVVFDLAFYGKIFYIFHQNVFFTLALGLGLIWILDVFWEKKTWNILQKIGLSILCSVGILLLAELARTDYSSYGVLAICVMYMVHKMVRERIKLWAPIVLASGIAILCLCDFSEVWAFLGLPLFCFYQGKKGWGAKWFFYFFYPVHLALLALACLLLGLKEFTIF